METDNRFPIRMFSIYFLYYAAQAIFNTYINLYLSSLGFSKAQIGLTVSVSTIFILSTQLIWGRVSDRSKNRARVLTILFLLSMVTVLLFYLSKSYWYILIFITLFSIFFVPAVPIQDNLTLKLLENSRYDYGVVRMGGTVGYSLTVLLAGFVLNGHYSYIFFMVAALLMICTLFTAFLPKVAGETKEKGKTDTLKSLKKVFTNKSLVALILFSLAFYFGLNFYNNFYLIYFASPKIGGTSVDVGILMFTSALTEVPCLLFMNKLINKMGVDRVLILAGVLSCLRWILLGFFVNPAAIIIANLLQGFTYTAFSYGIITYIDSVADNSVSASAQALNVLICSIFTKIVFGYLGGLASDCIGVTAMMYISAAVVLAATFAFLIFSQKQRHEKAISPNL